MELLKGNSAEIVSDYFPVLHLIIWWGFEPARALFGFVGANHSIPSFNTAAYRFTEGDPGTAICPATSPDTAADGHQLAAPRLGAAAYCNGRFRTLDTPKWLRCSANAHVGCWMLDVGCWTLGSVKGWPFCQLDPALMQLSAEDSGLYSGAVENNAFTGSRENAVREDSENCSKKNEEAFDKAITSTPQYKSAKTKHRQASDYVMRKREQPQVLTLASARRSLI